MNTPNWKRPPKSTVKQRTILPYEIWSIFYETVEIDSEFKKVRLDLCELDQLERCIEGLLQDNHTLRRMLYHMTSLTDWLREGYSEDGYNALVAEFDRRRK